MTPNPKQALEHAARRAAADPFFLGFVVADFQKRNALSDDALAERLGCTANSLTRLFLCRRPDFGDNLFVDQVRQIAEFAPCDNDRLLTLLREASSLLAFTDSPAAQNDNHFLAARDRHK